MKTEFPFPYLQHGTIALDTITKANGAYIAFQKPLPKKSREDVMLGCPKPINGMWAWGPNLVACESMGDTFDWELAAEYADVEPESIGDAAAAEFFDDVEEWIQGVHAKFPIAFFVGPCGVEEASPWGRWSQEVLPGIMIPFLEKYAEDNAKALAKDAPKRDHDPEDLVFDFVVMSCLLQHLPESGDKGLRRRAAALRKKFPI